MSSPGQNPLLHGFFPAVERGIAFCTVHCEPVRVESGCRARDLFVSLFKDFSDSGLAGHCSTSGA